jgi:hypothetical protein
VAALYTLLRLKKAMHPCTSSEPLNWIFSQKHRTTRHPSGLLFCAKGGVGRPDMTLGFCSVASRRRTDHVTAGRGRRELCRSPLGSSGA